MRPSGYAAVEAIRGCARVHVPSSCTVLVMAGPPEVLIHGDIVEVILANVLRHRGVWPRGCSEEAGRAPAIIVPEHVVVTIVDEIIAMMELIEIAMVEISVVESMMEVPIMKSIMEMVEMMVIIKHERR